MEKARLDKVLVERALVPSRERAQALILAGKVLVDGQKIEKAGAQVALDSTIRLLGEDLRYVSRGGLKLERALAYWNIDVRAKNCLDVGASTGGFTDCLLQHGASRVIAVDVGTNQLDWKLRQDPRVVSLEKTNARYLTFEQVKTLVDFVTVDVSFISSTLILPALLPMLKNEAEALVLVKPQFEVGRDQVGKGGIVRDTRLHREAITKVSHTLLALGFNDLASVASDLPGASGNREFFLRAVWRKSVLE